jgi:hypothetical protein
MRVNIILEYKSNCFDNKEEVIERITKENNADYLVKGEDNPEFPYLSQVENYDYSTFGAHRMDGLIKELLIVREEVNAPDDKAHIDDIIHLAKKCKRMSDTVLTFAG